MKKKATYTFVEDENRTVTAIDQNVIDTTSTMVNAYQVGKMYRYFNHTFAIWGAGKMKNDETGKISNHVTFIVTFDGNTAQKHYLDSEGIKQKIGDERRAPRAASMDSNGKATKVKRTVDETAAQIQTKYADTIKIVREKVGKLQDDTRIASALNLLCTMIEQTAAERIENITNAAKNAHLANVARREQATAELNQKQAEMQSALSNCDFAKVAVLGNAAKELQAELILLEQKIAEYETAQIASEATEPAVDESEESVSE